MITQMFLPHLVAEIDHQTTFHTYESEVISNRKPSDLEQRVMIWVTDTECSLVHLDRCVVQAEVECEQFWHMDRQDQ